MVRIFIEFALIFNLVPNIWAQNMSGNSSDREHKVHNIVLYPDRHSWCISTPIIQEVGHPGCGSVKTENNVCVGTCFSYVVPRAIPERLGDLTPYCDTCQPTRVSWKKVTLECKEGVYQNQNLTKHVEFIHDCHCGSCKSMNDRKEYEEGDDIEDDDDDSSEDTGSLIRAGSANATSEVNHMSPNSSQSEFKTAISKMLLKTMNHEDESVLENAESKGLHRNVWKILLEKIETADNSTNTTNFNDIVKSVEDEHRVKFNHKRLKQVLLKLKKLGGNRKLSNLYNKTLIDQADNSSRITETTTMTTTTMMTNTTTTTTTTTPTTAMRNDSNATSTTGVSPQVIATDSHPLKSANNETNSGSQGNVEKLATSGGAENRTAI